jgi:hypothetical protein
MNAKTWISVIAAALLALNSSAAFGQGKGHGKGHDKDKHEDAYAYSSAERESVNEWYRQHENHLPPGLAKRDQLPPGLEKQLQERGTLPPGLQKKIEPVPMDLERRLPPPPEGCDCRHVFIGGHVVLVGIRTNYVYNVFHFEIR